jgi:hypothetical protein
MNHCLKLTALLALFTLAGDLEAGEKKVRRKLFGELTKVEAGAVTLKMDKDGKAATFTLSDKTGVMIETDEDEIIKLDKGATMRQPVEKRGSVKDLKTGQRLSVVTYDGTSAWHIVIKRAKKTEGEKK